MDAIMPEGDALHEWPNILRRTQLTGIHQDMRVHRRPAECGSLMALANIYVEALENTLGLAPGWLANWPPHTRVSLGDVGSLEWNEETGLLGFRGGGFLKDYGIKFTAPADSEPLADITLTTGSETRVEFGFDASTPKWNWLGNAKAGFLASFGDEGGMKADLVDIRRGRIDRLDDLREALLEAATSEKLKVGSAIVVEVETSEKGMIIASTEHAAKLKVSTDLDVKPAKIKLASFAASFTVKDQSGAAVTQPMKAQFPVAFRTLVIGRRGIWWWKRIVVFGAADMGAQEVLDATEEDLTPDDYVVTFD